MKNCWFGRRTFVPFICVAMLFAANESLAQPKEHNVTLTTQIKTKSEKETRVTRFEQKGSLAIDTTIEGRIFYPTLTVTLYNSREQQETVQLEWYFLSKNTKGKAKVGKTEVPVRDVFDAGKKKVSLGSGARATETIVPKPLRLKIITRDILNESTGNLNTKVKEIGDTYLGYLVLVTVDGEIIAKDASSYPYLKEEWIETCRNFRPGKKGKGKR